MSKEESKWYEKASGKKNHKTKNVQRLKEKSVSKTQNETQSLKKTPSRPARRDNFNKNILRQPMFDSKNIDELSQKILNDFGNIVLEARNMSGKQKTLLAAQIKKLSHFLTDQRGERRLGYMNDAAFVSAYISYFMWWNLVRLTRLFSNLPDSSFNLKDNDVCLDIGSGPLTVVIALWLSRPALRSKKLTFYCMDLSQTTLAAGEEIYLNIAAKTIKNNEEPWKIVRVKGALGSSIKEKAALVTCANVFNEIRENSQMPPDYLAKSYTQDIEKYLKKDSATTQEVLLVEPGDPKSARLISLMRDAFIRRDFVPLSPCPHIHYCPMEGRTTSNPAGKWCNFAFDTENAPAELLKLSQKANLSKDRAGLSYVLLKRQKETDTKKVEDKKLKLRVASDFIKLPELHKSAYYCCSELGLVLAVDKTNVKPLNGDLIEIKSPKDPDSLARDKKSGALIIEI